MDSMTIIFNSISLLSFHVKVHCGTLCCIAFVAVEFQIEVNDNYFSRAITLAIRLGSCEVSAFRSGVAIWLFPSSNTDAAKGLRLLFQLFQND